jgi:hypothetical protein
MRRPTRRRSLALLPLLLVPLLGSCAFRAGVKSSRVALDRGAPDEALRILGELEVERGGHGPSVLARFDFVRGAALYEIGRQEEARTALHGARAEDLAAHGALATRDRVRLAKLLDELDAGHVPGAAPAPDKDAPKPPDKTDKSDKPDKTDKPDKPDEPKDTGDKADKTKPAKIPLPIAIACSGAVNTPAGIYGGYMFALNKKDAECVLAHTTKEFADKYREMLEFAIKMVDSAEGKVLDEKIDGTAATLKVHEKIVISIDGMESTSERDKTLKLVVEDGTWKLETLDEASDDDSADYPDDDMGGDDPGDPGDGDDGDDGGDGALPRLPGAPPGR